MKKLKEIFAAAMRPFQRAEVKTYARIRLDDEKEHVRIVEAADRDVKKLDIPANAVSLFFFDAKVKPGQELSGAEAFSRSFNHSPVHFFADRIMTQGEFRAMDEEERSKVTAFISGNHAYPDVASELFILDEDL